MRGLQRLVVARPWVVVLGWLLVVAAAVPLAGSLSSHLGTATLESPGSASSAGRAALARDFEGRSAHQVLLVPDGPTTPAGCQALAARAGEVQGVERAVALPSAGRCIATVGVADAPNAVVERLREDRARLSGAVGAQVLVSGAPGVSVDVGAVSEQGVRRVEVVALPVVFLLLLLVFGTAVAAFLPLVAGGVAIVTSLGLIAVIARWVELSPLLLNVVTMLGLGVAIDYSLFVTRRFRGELAAGRDIAGAVTTAMATAGRSVRFAGATVVLSLACLLLPDSLVTTSVAVGGATVVLVSVAVAATLLPAVLRLLGHRVDRLPLAHLAPRRLRHSRATGTNTWARTAALVARRPILGLAAGLAVLVPLAASAPQLEAHLPAGAYAELPAGTESRRALEVAGADGTSSNTLFPVQVLASPAQGITPEDAEGAMAVLGQQLQAVPGVVAVVPPGPTDPSGAATVSRNDSTHLFTVVPEAGPADASTRAIVSAVRGDVADAVAPALELTVTGDTATALDVDQHLADALPRTVGLLLVATVLLLLLAFRSAVLPLRAVLLNALVTAAALGGLVLGFQEGLLPGIDPAPLNVNTPVILIALLFGLSVDYEVIVVDRISELRRHGASAREAVVQGIGLTAGMVNGAAAVMVVVFSAFLLADFRVVQELGFALALAIALDVLVARTVVLPATMALLGERAWWPARPVATSSGLAPAAVPAAPSSTRDPADLVARL